jgi:Ca2+-binding EF-hand superfamily protein
MKPATGERIVKDIVNQWSQIYVNQVFFLKSHENIHQFRVEFSRPHKTKPIPEATVKVDFYVIDKAGKDVPEPKQDEDYSVEFNFENESLRHTLHQTMRKTTFEAWLDRILEKKIKIKKVLHLGTEFEYSRIVDEEGKIVDPFVPKFDLTKITDLSKEVRDSQKVNVHSPRFINTLRVALFKIFQDADKDGSGFLSYEQFEDAFKNLSYGLCDNDVQNLIALADEDKDGKISWEEFVPVGIDAIRTFFSRNKVLKLAKERKREANKEAMACVYMDEINKSHEILTKRFKLIDEEETGQIKVSELKRLFKETCLLTPKEINLFIRNLHEENFKYDEFKARLFDVRFEIAKSRILETNIDSFQEKIIEECKAYDESGNGKIDLRDLRTVLFKSKHVNLSPF